MSDSIDCLKHSMFFFNLLFFLSGAVTLGVGIWAATGAQSFRDILIDNPIIFDGVYIIIAIGAALTILGFLGCYGAVKESKCFLGMFFVLVLIIFIVEVVGAILIFVHYPRVKQLALNTISRYEDDTTFGALITQGWDTFQATVGCCGFTNYTEWENNTDWDNRFSQVVPDSCCKRDILSLGGTITNVIGCRQGIKEFVNTEGCSVILHNYIWAVAGVGIAILLFELLGMIFSGILYDTTRRQRYS